LLYWGNWSVASHNFKTMELNISIWMYFLIM
jgi:hypothetical protein